MSHPLVILGAPRSGTTLLASILSCSGSSSGLPDRDSNPSSGYYEHPLLISRYGDLKMSRLLANYSDYLSNYFRIKVLQKLRKLSSRSQLFKFPLLSFMLPPLLMELGFNPITIVIYRSFSAYATSCFKHRSSISYSDIKQIFLEAYHQSSCCLVFAQPCLSPTMSYAPRKSFISFLF